MSTNRIFKKGEIIFKEGDKVTCLYMVQAGSVSVFLQRPKFKIELGNIGNMQLLAEYALSGASTHPSSAMAVTETKVVELPVEAVKPQIDTLSQVMKFVFKGLSDKTKAMSNELKSMKMERDNTPCPADQTAKIFGAIYHTASHKGTKEATKDGEHVVVPWVQMKQYAQRIFLENPKRLETAINILVKLKLADYEVGKDPENPEGPDEIQAVHFKDLVSVEQFFEFFQYYYFKGGKSELLKVEETPGMIATRLLELMKGIAPDRFGSVRIEYPKILEYFKTQAGMNINNDHFAVLEQKGLFVKRQSTDQGVYLSLEIKEWQRTLMNWRILKEIEKWNEKGTVDLKEPEDSFIKKAKTDGPVCSSCQVPFTAGQKFCGNCGAKIEVAA